MKELIYKNKKLHFNEFDLTEIAIEMTHEGWIDLKKKTDSAIHELELLRESNYVYIKELKENHRHPAVFEVLDLLNRKK